MSIYMEQIEQLVVLQKVDSEMITLERILEDAPKQLRNLQEKQAYLKQQQAVIQEKVDVLMEQKTRLEGEIENDSQKVKKSKNKLMMVENTKEYHAMMREMDTMEKMNRNREEERANLLADLSDLEGRKDALQNDINELEAIITAQQSTLDQELAEKRARIQILDKDKKKASEAVPAPILTRYNFIRSRIPTPVIVPVSEGVCKGCHVVIPPQAFIDLQKGEQILSCPNCLRIIFWERHFSGND
ncbi:MAG: C4-type zinc ribbon domain-containing protein [Desulfomicrobium sp.]|nr:C4-type zinc ribbon domain-containing protein [Desulfomicrobium sp.]